MKSITNGKKKDLIPRLSNLIRPWDLRSSTSYKGTVRFIVTESSSSYVPQFPEMKTKSRKKSVKFRICVRQIWLRFKIMVVRILNLW